MTKHWNLTKAKVHFKELVQKAQSEGAQYISVHGKPAVVVISQKEYLSVTKPSISLVEFLQKSPLAKSKPDLF